MNISRCDLPSRVTLSHAIRLTEPRHSPLSHATSASASDPAKIAKMNTLRYRAASLSQAAQKAEAFGMADLSKALTSIQMQLQEQNDFMK